MLFVFRFESADPDVVDILDAATMQPNVTSIAVEAKTFGEAVTALAEFGHNDLGGSADVADYHNDLETGAITVCCPLRYPYR